MRFLFSGFIILLLAFLDISIAHSQERSNEQSKDDRLMKAATEIMNEAGTCALITLDKAGNPRVRAMDPFAQKCEELA